jgi:hypothetical protein
MDTRNEKGDFAPTVSDEQIIEAWNLEQSTKRVAARVGLSPSQVRKRLAKIREKIANVEGDIDRESKLRQLLASVPLNGPEGSRVKQIDVKLWGVAAKNNEGDLITQGLDGLSARYHLASNKTAVYPPIAPHYIIEAPTYIPVPRAENDGYRKVFCIGDVQCGYWRDDNGNLIPFHDEAAMDLCLQMLALDQPDEVVILGDALDLPEFGKYRKEPAFFNTTNPAIARMTEFLAKIRSIVGPDCVISYIMGNHELRLTSAIVDNLCALNGIRRHDAGDTFGVLTIPFLLQFERFNIKCTDQYPTGEVWLTDNLVCTHAPDRKIAATVICGHLIKATVDSETRYYHDGPRVNETIVVPGLGNYRGKPDDKFRITRTNIPSNVGRTNAQQAVATIDITPDGKRHNIQVWKIEDGSAFFREHGMMYGTAQPWEYLERVA